MHNTTRRTLALALTGLLFTWLWSFNPIARQLLSTDTHAAPVNTTYRFEDIANNGTTFTSSGQTFSLTGNMIGVIATDLGSNLELETGYSSGYMDSGFGESRSGNVGGIAAPAGYTFRAQMFDVWPSQDQGGNVSSPPQDIMAISTCRLHPPVVS